MTRLVKSLLMLNNLGFGAKMSSEGFAMEIDLVPKRDSVLDIVIAE